MKAILLSVLLTWLTANSYAQIVNNNKRCLHQNVQQSAHSCNKNPWVLVFEDNFDGNSLDLSKWEIQGWGQGALSSSPNQEYNTLDNVEVSNGSLKIIAKKESVQRRAVSWRADTDILEDGLPNLRTYEYTSSNIWSKPTFSYGKFEARIKIPKGKGFWPAFWTFSRGDTWNEIDIFEFWNERNFFGFRPSKLSNVHHMNTHYDHDHDGRPVFCPLKYTGEDFSQDFHIFSVVWDFDKISWFVDGELKAVSYRFRTLEGDAVECPIAAGPYQMNQAHPQEPMSIIFNLAIQSNRRDAPDRSTLFPGHMEVDWVRYYQQKPLSAD